MNPNLAEENLQTIRTLMERSALYRRALAPIMLLAGILGLLAAAIGLCFHVEWPKAFAVLWLGTACVVVTSAFLLARRQALKDHEPFWSPPTYRVGQALLPPLLSGLFVGGLLAIFGNTPVIDFLMLLAWLFFYGCALHSAGFFMVRGIKWFGWIFIAGGVILMISWQMHLLNYNYPDDARVADCLMGLFFGALHFAYGVYLYFTEKKTPVA
jgi:hypothetical protein